MTAAPNTDDVRAAAALCKAVYSGAHDVESALAHVNISVLGRSVYIVFRGTANIRDWITDVEAHKITAWTGCGYVHQGFYDAIRSVIDQIIIKLDGHTDPDIIILGHSLGGALADLCAYYFILRGIKFSRVITFGQPRVGDAQFAEVCGRYFGDRHFRYVNQEDIVPRVPGVLLGYRHSGVEEFLPSFGGLKVAPRLPFLALSDAFGIFREWRNGAKLALLADHPIDRYIERLASL